MIFGLNVLVLKLPLFSLLHLLIVLNDIVLVRMLRMYYSYSCIHMLNVLENTGGGLCTMHPLKIARRLCRFCCKQALILRLKMTMGISRAFFFLIDQTNIYLIMVFCVVGY